MDNLRRHKNRSTRPSITDGFLPSKGSKPADNFFGDKQKSDGMPTKRKLLDDFGRQSDFGAKKSPRPKLAGPDGLALGRRPLYEKIEDEKLLTSGPTKKRFAKIRSVRLFSLRTGSLAVIVCLIMGGYLFGKAYLKAQEVFQGGVTAAVLNGDIDPSQLHGEGDGRVNILLLGKSGQGHAGPNLTDTILLASIDPIQKDVGLLSIPRDLWVQNANGGANKINAVYAFAKENAVARGLSPNEAEKAGTDAIRKKVSEILGIPVQYYVMVDFGAFKDAVDTVGGIDLKAPQAVQEWMSLIEGKRYYLNVQPGLQHFDGIKALAYARSRHTSPRGDFDRAERQRLIIAALKVKVLSLGTFGNPLKISQLLDTFGTHVRSSLGINEVMKLYNLGKDIDNDKVVSIGLADPPNNFVTTGMYGDQSIVQPTAGLFNYGPIQKYVRNKLKDSFIRKEHPNILVLNGTTTPGLATAKTAELQSFGYHVIKTDDAPTKTYANTTLIDLRDGEKKYTKRYLELRLKTTATTSLPAGIVPGDADFVIIVGRNETINS